jgi:WD40 repeat protein/serine/threonine protein kinase
MNETWSDGPVPVWPQSGRTATSESSAPSPDDRLDALAEEFLARRRNGEQPSVEEYAAAHADLADAIRRLFPALLALEDLKPDSAAVTGSHAGAGAGAAGPRSKLLPDRVCDFRILREVGRGGMGIVYEAEQESLGRRVALKVLAVATLLDPRQLARFHREARAAVRLHHTNIVPVFGVGESAGVHYYVMQFIAGLGLDQVLVELRRLRGQARTGGGDVGSEPAYASAGPSAAAVAGTLLTGTFAGPRPAPPSNALAAPGTPAVDRPGEPSAPLVALPGEEGLSAASDSGRQYARSVARIGVQVAEALAYAHRQGVLHRDIKPSNLLLDGHGNAWVADFGLAKAVADDDLTHTGDLVGTLRYMAPERFRGGCEPRSDVYALGLTLYELLALRPAYEGSDRNDLIRRISSEAPPRLRRLEPAAPRDLETIVHKAIEPDPGHRYASAEALAADLRCFLEDRPIAARRARPGERLARWSRRNPALATLLAVVAALLLTIAAGSSVLAWQIGRKADEARAEATRAEFANDALRATQETLRKTLYAARVGLAHAAWLEGGVERARRMLKETRPAPREPDRRGFEWHYLHRLLHSQGLTLHAHSALARIAWHPDGTRLTSIGADSLAKIWDAASGRQLRAFRGHEGGAYHVAYSPDGRRLATCGEDGYIKLWDADSGAEQVPPGGRIRHADVKMAAFSPDGQRLASCSTDGIRVWDAATGTPPWTLAEGGEMVAYSPDGKVLAAPIGPDTVRLWNADDGAALRELHGHGSGPTKVALAFALDGHRLAAAGLGGTTTVWDIDSGRALVSFPGLLWSLAFSPDGRHLATAGVDRVARLRDAATGGELATYRVGADFRVAYCPDGRRLAASNLQGDVMVWDVALDQRTPTIAATAGQTYALACSPDGRHVATGGSDDLIKIWDLDSPGAVLTLRGHSQTVNVVAYSPDGRQLASLDFGKTLRLWDAATGRPQHIIRDDLAVPLYPAFRGDGRRLAVPTRQAVRIYDPETGKAVTELPQAQDAAAGPVC